MTALAATLSDTTRGRDLASKHPEKVQELESAWQTWNAELAEPLWGGRGQAAKAKAAKGKGAKGKAAKGKPARVVVQSPDRTTA